MACELLRYVTLRCIALFVETALNEYVHLRCVISASLDDKADI